MCTSPMTFADAENCLRLTVTALSNVLDARDQQFLEQAMRSYGCLCWAGSSNIFVSAASPALAIKAPAEAHCLCPAVFQLSGRISFSSNSACALETPSRAGAAAHRSA